MMTKNSLFVIFMCLMALSVSVKGGDLGSLFGGEFSNHINQGERVMGVYELNEFGNEDGISQFQREVYKGLSLNPQKKYKIELFASDPTVQDTNCRVVCIPDSETGKLVCVKLC